MEIIHPQFSVLTPPDGGKAHSPRQGRHDRSLGITSIRFTRPGWCASECFRANMTRNVSRGPLRGPVIFCRFFPGLRSFVADAGLSAQTPPGLQFKKMRTLLRTLPLAVGCNPFRISPPPTDLPPSQPFPLHLPAVLRTALQAGPCQSVVYSLSSRAGCWTGAQISAFAQRSATAVRSADTEIRAPVFSENRKRKELIFRGSENGSNASKTGLHNRCVSIPVDPGLISVPPSGME